MGPFNCSVNLFFTMTIYFNEICDLPIDTQAKLINVIQDQSFYKYGSNKKIKIDIRVVAGTSYDPIEAVKNGILKSKNSNLKVPVFLKIAPDITSNDLEAIIKISSQKNIAGLIIWVQKIIVVQKFFVFLDR